MKHFLALILFILLSISAYAQTSAPEEISEKTYPRIEPDPRNLKKTGTAFVREVIDGLRLQLDDKRIIQLSSLDIPDLLQAEPGAFSVAARELLEELFKDKKVILYQSKDPKEGRNNRMGHELAHLTRHEDNVWAQGALLYEGLARVRTTLENKELASEMLAIENQARNKIIATKNENDETAENTSNEKAKGIGLWSNELYMVHTPSTAPMLRQDFQIIEGTVTRVASRKNTLYLNFGKNWRTDFTIGIDTEARRRFSRAGHNLMQWGGKTIRVRGWLEEYNGPYIKIDHPERIEVIEEDAAEAAPEQLNPTPSQEDVRDALPNPENIIFNR